MDTLYNNGGGEVAKKRKISMDVFYYIVAFTQVIMLSMYYSAIHSVIVMNLLHRYMHGKEKHEPDKDSYLLN